MACIGSLRLKFREDLFKIMTTNAVKFLNMPCDNLLPRKLCDENLLSSREAKAIGVMESWRERQLLIFEKVHRRLDWHVLNGFLNVMIEYEDENEFTMSVEKACHRLKKDCDLPSWFEERVIETVVRHWFFLCEYDTNEVDDMVLICLATHGLLTDGERNDIENTPAHTEIAGVDMSSGLCHRTDRMLRKLLPKLTNETTFQIFMKCIESHMGRPEIRHSMETMLLM